MRVSFSLTVSIFIFEIIRLRRHHQTQRVSNQWGRFFFEKKSLINEYCGWMSRKTIRFMESNKNQNFDRKDEQLKKATKTFHIETKSNFSEASCCLIWIFLPSVTNEMQSIWKSKIKKSSTNSEFCVHHMVCTLFAIVS